MNNARVYIELAKIRPEWPTHSIVSIIERADSNDIMDDPRMKSINKAEQLALRWDAKWKARA